MTDPANSPLCGDITTCNLFCPAKLLSMALHVETQEAKERDMRTLRKDTITQL
jgi:hypothetical protein